MSLGGSFLSRRFSRSVKNASAKKSSSLSSTASARLGLHSCGDRLSSEPDRGEGGSWSNLLPELLREIMERVEGANDQWPQRQNVVACACVCKKWREAIKEIVRASQTGGSITFPSCLKQVIYLDRWRIIIFLCKRQTYQSWLYFGVMWFSFSFASISFFFSFNFQRLNGAGNLGFWLI